MPSAGTPADTDDDLWLRWVAARALTCYLVVLLGALAVYLFTAHWVVSQNSDALVASLPSHQLLTSGTLDLRGSYPAGELPGIVEADGRLVVARTLGVVLAGLPGAALLGWTGASAAACGALSAVLWSAAAVANLHLVLRGLVPPAGALIGAATLALGTGLWTIGAAELWAHGPDAFWLSLALVGLSRQRWWLAGVGMGAAIMTRPHLAVAAALLGLWLALALRRWGPLWGIGLPSATGLGLLVAWNDWYYGVPSIGGMYDYALPHATRAVDEGGSLFLENLAGVLVSPLNGLLVYSPVVAVGLWALAAAGLAGRGGRHALDRPTKPPWVTAAAVAGLTHLLVQMRISHSFTGGSSYFGNRYGIETLVLATPLLTVALVHWARAGSWTRIVALTAAGASCAVYGFGALVPRWWMASSASDTPWTSWIPGMIFQRGEPPIHYAAAVSWALLVAVVAAALWDRRRHRAGRPAPAASPLSGQLVRS